MKKAKLILPLLIIILTTVSIGYFVLNQQENTDRNASSSISKEIEEKADDEPVTTEEEQRQENEGSVSKPSISTLEQSEGTLVVRTVINSAKSGSCKLTLKKGDQIVEKTASIGLVTSYYTCQGFDVPTSELELGTWDVSVTVSTGGTSATSNTKEVEITK